MKILAIDTATDVCGVALAQDDELVADVRLHQKKLHNEKLISSIQYLLEQVSWQSQDLDGIAFVNGPGSFTGLRIGISVAKGLAYAWDLPVVAVNTLDSFAERAKLWRGPICVAMKVRAAELYIAMYEGTGDAIERKSEDRIISVSELAEFLNEQTLVLCNPPQLLKAQEVSPAILAGADLTTPSPELAARIGLRKLEQKKTASPDDLEPFYLKEFKPKRKNYYAEPSGS